MATLSELRQGSWGRMRWRKPRDISICELEELELKFVKHDRRVRSGTSPFLSGVRARVCVCVRRVQDDLNRPAARNEGSPTASAFLAALDADGLWDWKGQRCFEERESWGIPSIVQVTATSLYEVVGGTWSVRLSGRQRRRQKQRRRRSRP